MVWEPRTYRRAVDPAGLVSFEVRFGETDLQVCALRDLSREAGEAVAAARAELESYIVSDPRFRTSFVPVEVPADAPPIVRVMAAAGRAAGVGPMAAVAGAIAERVARALEPLSAEVIVENGGDLYLTGRTGRSALLLAGDSPLSGRASIALAPEDLPVAVCTSSGKVGHSVSLGSAHAVTVVAEDGAVADAVATALGNRVHEPGDIARALARGASIPGVRGIVVIAGDRIGAAGGITLSGV